MYQDLKAPKVFQDFQGLLTPHNVQMEAETKDDVSCGCTLKTTPTCLKMSPSVIEGAAPSSKYSGRRLCATGSQTGC